MRFKLLLVLVILISSLTACKKDKQDTSSKNPLPIKEPVEQSFYKALKIDSIRQLSIVISYQLTKNAKVTGVVRALDSITLADRLADYMHSEAVFRNSQYHAKIAWPYNLPPINDKIWFRLYVIDENGTKTYSPIFSQNVATYQVKNKYVVNGRAIYNNHPKDFFMNYEGGAIGTYDNSLIVDAITSDVKPQNYRATLNEIPVSISKIDPKVYPPTHKYILFDVPDDFPPGPATFKFYYQNKMVYTEDLTVVSGGLLTSVRHPISQTSSGCFFEYGGKLFTYTNSGMDPADANFYSWTPGTNVWQKLPHPSERPYLNFNNVGGGRTINNIVYFAPVMNRTSGVSHSYEELITSYNPATGEWKKKRLLYTTDKSEDRSMRTVECFAYRDKLYCITSEFPFEQMGGMVKYQIRVYDPVNDSWAYYMGLPDGVWGWVSVVNANQVYLLAVKPGKQASATTEFVNEFYLLDMPGKSMVKKKWITDREVGVNAPYLASFNNKVYAYGGHYASGFSSLYSSLFAMYDPQQDKWSPVSGYSYFTGWVSQTSGFMLPIANKLYLGLGVDRYTNGHIHGSKINYSIYQVGVR